MEPPPSSDHNASRSSNINQMAYCHECNIDIRPLLTPDPTCPRCNGQFVEIIDSSSSPVDDLDHLPFDTAPGSGYTFRTLASSGINAASPLSFVTASASGAPQTLPGGLGDLLMALTSGRTHPDVQNSTSTEDARSDSQARARSDYYSQHQASSPDPDQSTSNHQAQNTTQTAGTTSFGPFGLQWNVQYASSRDDPYARAAQQHAQNTQQQNSMRDPPTLSNFLQFAFGAGRPDPTSSPPRSQDAHLHDDGMGGAGASSDGRHFNHDNSATYHQPPQSPNHDRSSTNPDMDRRTPSDVPPELDALRNLFAGLFGEPGTGGSLLDFLASGAHAGGMRGGGARGQWGDYVLGQQGLDDIISQLMEQTQGSTAPPPATEDVIDKLERFTRRDRKRIERAKNQDCPTCKDDLLASQESTGMGGSEKAKEKVIDQAEKEEEEEEEDLQQDELISMPCNHIFHLDCLVPWLRLHGTCPVCRVSIVTPREESESNSGGGGGERNPEDDPSEQLPGGWPPPPNPMTSLFNPATLVVGNYNNNDGTNNTEVQIPHETDLLGANATTTIYHPHPATSTTLTSTIYPIALAPSENGSGGGGEGQMGQVVNSVISSPPIVSDRAEFFNNSNATSSGGQEMGDMRERMLRAAEARVGGSDEQQQQGQGAERSPSSDTATNHSAAAVAPLEPDELD
ncbi:uncharacterized protein MEPE_04388 [Melanopsichium pennsylvanicum]|uniref:RING-type E3 ubiquitin transferase n=2 Tax=Melanopsichium pennsylvanicum TaxID=63383 RepID=A0AAJ5C6N7_9BASI|nr:zinc finger containing protein [Melanopsichium pennsylvanicum 4]SNX85679.1 uncharacterized protein MEPE_04388 [Melanopsichium pennsylvanicum]